MMCSSLLGFRTPAGISSFLFVTSGWILSLIFHEFGHAIVAWRGGDLSVAPKGYLTLNPLKYAHVVTSIIIPVGILLYGGIGLPGGAVYIDRSKLSPARESGVSAAGPIANLICAALLLAPLSFGWVPNFNFGSSISPDELMEVARPAGTLAVSLAFLGGIQLLSAVLNLIPVPPLDGFGIIEPLMPANVQATFRKVSGWGFGILFLLIFFTPLGQVIYEPVYIVFELFGWDISLFIEGFSCFQFWQSDQTLCDFQDQLYEHSQF